MKTGAAAQRTLPRVPRRCVAAACLGFLLPAGSGGIAFPTGPGHLHGQVVERERQEALLPGRGVLEITPELRSRLGLFPEVEGFRVARLLLRGEGGGVLEIESVREGRLERERRLLTGADLEAFRSDLTARLDAPGTRVVATREGRGGLVLGQTLLGLGYHGWAVPAALDISSAQGAVGAYLLTAGASFYLPYRLTRDRTVTDTHRNLLLFGGTRGIGAGLLLGDLLMSDDKPANGSNRNQVRWGGGVVLGATGSVLGFLAADRWDPTSGTAALWSAMGDAGLAAGAGLAYAAGPYEGVEREVREGDLVYFETRARNRRLGHAVTLTGGVAGLALGGWMGARQEYTQGNASVLRSAMVLGAQVGATAARSAVGNDRGRVVAGGALVGGGAGIVLGDRILRGQALSPGEGLLVNAGHLAGGATALGITYLLVEELGDRPVLYLATSTVGSLAGAGLVWRAVAPTTTALELSPSPPSRRGREFTFHPTGLLPSLMDGGGAAAESRIPPLVTVRF